MGNSLILVLAGIAMLVFAATETHAAGFAFGTQDYYFQLYDGQEYTYSVTPYTYVSDDYYYFDYPFRFYNGASYYYFQPGWYNFNPSFYLYPYASYYSYYPATYYYYNSSWVYSPNWLYTYGPMHYGNYFYPPRQATLTGSQYKPTKEADCAQASLAAQDFTISEGETKAITISLYNGSPKYLDVQNAMVFVDGPDVEARNVKFDRVVMNGASGTITFDALAATNPLHQNARGTVKVYGTFRDGTTCSGNDISQDFTISIEGQQNQQAIASSVVDNSNKYNGNSYYNAQNSVAQPSMIAAQPAKVSVDIQNFAFSPNDLTISAGDTVTWTNLDSPTHTVTSDSGGELDSGAIGNGQAYSHTFTAPGTYTYHCAIHPMMKGTVIVNSQDFTRTGNANLGNTNSYYNPHGSASYEIAKESQQHWAEAAPSTGSGYGSTTINNDTGAASFSGTTNAMDYGVITTDYGRRQRVESDCSGLGITAENLSVGAGSGNYNYALLKNYGSEDFTIDSIRPMSNGEGFTLEATRSAQKVYSGQSGAIRVSASAINAGADSTSSAYLVVDGHYGSGMQCKVLSENFLVHVNAAERTPLGKAKLVVPSQAEIIGTSGFITVKYENNSNEDATITANSSDASVSPAEVAVAAHTTGNSTFAVNGFDASKGGRVYFTASAGGLKLTERYVELVKAPAAQSVGVESPTSVASKPSQGAAPLQKINNLVGAGLAVIAGGNMALNAIVLLLLLAAAWALYRYTQK